MIKQVELSEEDRKELERIRKIILNECYKNDSKVTLGSIIKNSFKAAKTYVMIDKSKRPF